MTRVNACLRDENGNYVLPFFWQHGEDEAVLRKYMNAIHDANIREVCLEARPHPDYAGEQWFHDVDVILDEAKKLDMKLWILDDAHFPSGQAGGKMLNYPDDLQKQFLRYNAADVCGPMSQAFVDVAVMSKSYPDPFAQKSIFDSAEKKWFEDDRLFAVVAARLDGKWGDLYHMDEHLIDLTDQVSDGKLFWDVPVGTWRVFVIYETRNGGGRSGYVNFMSKKSCRVQIDECYEPHYARYKDEFGKTILGFFSDEPEVGNVAGYDASNSGIGNRVMPIPWSEEMHELMEARLGKDYKRKLVALWTPVGSEAFTAEIRVGYMDVATRQCQKNFGEQLGEWCRERGVEYIGHIVEDNDQSVRFGASQGHFFRALWGQDWAGIDNIDGQVTLGGANISHKGLMDFNANGEFYHQAMGKMGTSLADIDPKKRGRSMCEIFGAYGWDEGTRLMKYELDHFLVRGINHYVPHAFSPKDFPDIDCPPHFYAHGKNPLYKPFGELMTYTNRVSHLIDGGLHEVKVAVLYHAESEWAGGSYMDMVKPARVLNEHQIDFDFIPMDVFSCPADFDAVFNGTELVINRHVFKTLIVPGASYVPKAVVDFAVKAKNEGFPVYFAEQVPDGLDMYCPTALEQLPEELAKIGVLDVILDSEYKDVQIYHYIQEKEQYYLISNESAGETFTGNVTFKTKGVPYIYDAFKNELYTMDYSENEDSIVIPMSLAPYEMGIIVIPEDAAMYREIAKTENVFSGQAEVLMGPWKVSFVENENYPAFTDEIVMDRIENILRYKPDFSGVIRYENTFTAEEDCQLILENVYETAEVWVNGVYAGSRICPPYTFDLSGLCKAGENTLVIEVRTTLERKVHAMTGGKGFFGLEMNIVSPSGIVGHIWLRKAV